MTEINEISSINNAIEIKKTPLKKTFVSTMRNIINEIKLYWQFICSVWKEEMSVNMGRIPVDKINNYLKYPASKNDVLKALDKIKISANDKSWIKNNLPESVYFSDFSILLSLDLASEEDWSAICKSWKRIIKEIYQYDINY